MVPIFGLSPTSEFKLTESLGLRSYTVAPFLHPSLLLYFFDQRGDKGQWWMY